MSTTPPSKVVTPAALPNSQKQRWVMIGVGAAVLVALIAGIWIWKGSGEPPRYNASTLELVKYMTSSRFEKLPFEQRKPYLVVLEDRDDKDEVERLFAEGKITEAQGRAAKELAWAGKWLSRMDTYNSKPTPAAKAQWIASQVNKREKDKEKEKTTKKPVDPNAKAIERDQASEEYIPLSWPKDVQEHYNALRAAIKEEEKKHKKPATGPA